MSEYSEYNISVCNMLYMSGITQGGYSALIWAARDGRTEVVRQLVYAGANLNLQNKVCQCVDIHGVF